MSSLWLMYHDLFVDEPERWVPPTAAHYHVSSASFAAQLEVIKRSGLEILTAGEWRPEVRRKSVVLTFDDAWMGSIRLGLPILLDAGFRATYFVIRDFVGRRGFADDSALLEAHRAGMEVGVHGSSHRDLRHCTDAEIRRELGDCQKYLQDLLGAPVISSSAPGGGWNARIAAIAEELGFATLSTSRPGLNDRRTSSHCLRRMSLRRQSTVDDVAKLCRFELGAELWRWRVLQVPRRLMGDRLYTRLRRTLMRDKEHHEEIFRPPAS